MTAARPPTALTPSVPESAPAPGQRPGRAHWHRRAAAVPLVYLAGIVAIGFAHPFLPAWRWLAIHLLAGAATNAILVWSAHFTAAVLRTPTPPSRRGEVLRLGMLNLGLVGVLIGGTGRSPWAGVAGAAAVFGAVAAHLWWLATRLRTALPARFSISVRYYLAGGVALLTGVPVGAWMLVSDDAARPRLILFHAHVNLLGWITLTVLGTLLTFWPTVLRTRMPDGAVRAATAALPVGASGLGLLGLGLLAWWPVLAAAGLALVAAAIGMNARPAVAAARGRPPASFAAASIAAGCGWLLIALGVDAWAILSASGPADAAERFDAVLVPLLAGFLAQVLLGALAYLVPMALGGGPSAVRERTSVIDRHWSQRVAMTNAALVLFVLPTPAYVRITTSLLVLAGLVQFLLPAARILITARRTPMTEAATPAAAPRPTAPEAVSPPRRPLGGVAAGLALVLIAVLTGVAAQRASEPAALPAAATNVPATGHTTTVAVTAQGMRYHPDRIEVPAGDRLVIELTNGDNRRHDLVLANGAKTAVLDPGAAARLDAGIIGGTVPGWCSMPGHRQAGMTLSIVATGAAGPTMDHSGMTGMEPAGAIDFMATPPAGFTPYDATAPTTPGARTHHITLRVQEVEREVAPGVRQRLWTFNGTTPGPVMRGKVGDSFDVTLVNEGSVEHGIDFHAGAVAPDAMMRAIEPGQRLSYRFTATKAGIWMYHCSAMPMLMHIANGMYGAVIIDPPGLPAVDHEYVLVQSELYLGAAGEIGDMTKMQAETPDAVVFNGYVNQYVHRPLSVRAGERVRVWVLDAGPSRATAFHIVGAQFDTVYREGRWQLRPQDPGGSQILDLVPGAGGFVETVFPEPGDYPFVSHIMVDAERGARGMFEVR